MTPYKIDYIPAKKLSDKDRKKYRVKDNEFLKITVTNKGMEVTKVKSPIEEVGKAFRKNKNLKGFQL